jgi:hypothetical protein
MKTKIYDLVLDLLKNYLETRSSDKVLIWSVWANLGFTFNNTINYRDFILAPSSETIRRCRQKIQEIHPELKPSKEIQQLRLDISSQKGTHIFRERINYVR